LKQRFDDEVSPVAVALQKNNHKAEPLYKKLDRSGKTQEIDQSAENDGSKAKRRHGIGKTIAALLSLGLAGLSIYVLAHTIAGVDPAQLRQAIAATGGDQIACALGLTFVSFLALTGYDALALRQLRLHVPYKTTALASFASYAISFTLGFPLITAGSVRYWIYSQKGLSAGKVASLTIIAGVTFWLGMAFVIGISLVFRGHAISELNHIDPQLNRLMGYGILAALVAYLSWVSSLKRHVKVQGFRLELPGFQLTLGQVILGVIDLCAASGVLFCLLPAQRGLDYFTFAATYVFACILGIASNAPGGIGVFEAAILKSVPVTSQEALLASLLLFRILYYLVPFVLALALLGAHEAFRRWKSLRYAISHSSEEIPESGEADER
jgi:uncharacterized membrane protein YbhN (UPF0104 family)